MVFALPKPTPSATRGCLGCHISSQPFSGARAYVRYSMHCSCNFFPSDMCWCEKEDSQTKNWLANPKMVMVQRASNFISCSDPSTDVFIKLHAIVAGLDQQRGIRTPPCNSMWDTFHLGSLNVSIWLWLPEQSGYS